MPSYTFTVFLLQEGCQEGILTQCWLLGGCRLQRRVSYSDICYHVATDVATSKLMKSATVRELKNQASRLLRQAASEDVIITSRGRPVACLVGLRPGDLSVRPGVR